MERKNKKGNDNPAPCKNPLNVDNSGGKEPNRNAVTDSAMEKKNHKSEGMNNNDKDTILNVLGHFDGKNDKKTYRGYVKRKICIINWCVFGLIIFNITSIAYFIANYSGIYIIPPIVICLVVIAVSYWIYSIVQKRRRYQKALYKLDLLILRLKMGTDKDLVCRLDRELEMIYRILES